jgi:hypothetical protein
MPPEVFYIWDFPSTVQHPSFTGAQGLFAHCTMCDGDGRGLSQAVQSWDSLVRGTEYSSHLC